jgi:hypothetical protein
MHNPAYLNTESGTLEQESGTFEQESGAFERHALTVEGRNTGITGSGSYGGR